MPSARKSTRLYPADRKLIARFEDLPNVGPATASDFRLLGIHTPAELIGRDPIAMYWQLRELTHSTQDSCVADVFLATVRFMEGAPPLPWWHYTVERKRILAL